MARSNPGEWGKVRLLPSSASSWWFYNVLGDSLKVKALGWKYGCFCQDWILFKGCGPVAEPSFVIIKMFI